jgi:hypothetical protein
MSSIDVVDNIHCANIHLESTSVPVYWVQDTLKHDRTLAEVTTRDLMIGGGSGEHPALHIKNADLLPLWLLLQHISCDDNEENLLSIAEDLELMYVEKLKSRAKSEAEIINIIDFPYNNDNFMCIADWPLSTLAQVETCYKKTKVKDNISNYSETSLLVSIATFVMFDMPKQFFENDVYKLMEKSKIIFKDSSISTVFNFSLPLNSQKMGRVIKDGKVIWGYSLNDYLNQNN